MEELERNKNLADKQLARKELKKLKKEQKLEAREKERRQRKIKKTINIALVVLIFGGGILALGWFLVNRSSSSESEIISRDGIHWHADLSIKILGQYQEIPANIGRGITEQYIHTHEPDGVIHMEFPGLVRTEDIRLARFFEIWGKKFNKDCIFDKCSGEEGKLNPVRDSDGGEKIQTEQISNGVKMFVNDKENFEFENYIMQEGDKIEVIFEQ